MIRGYFRLEPDKTTHRKNSRADRRRGRQRQHIFRGDRNTGTEPAREPAAEGGYSGNDRSGGHMPYQGGTGRPDRKAGKERSGITCVGRTVARFQHAETAGRLAAGKTTEEALRDAKSAGRPKGPRREILQKLSLAFRMYHTAEHVSVSEICKTVKLNERTFYRHLERQQGQIIRRPKGRKPKNTERN